MDVTPALKYRVRWLLSYYYGGESHFMVLVSGKRKQKCICYPYTLRGFAGQQGIISGKLHTHASSHQEHVIQKLFPQKGGGRKTGENCPSRISPRWNIVHKQQNSNMVELKAQTFKHYLNFLVWNYRVSFQLSCILWVILACKNTCIKSFCVKLFQYAKGKINISLLASCWNSWDFPSNGAFSCTFGKKPSSPTTAWLMASFSSYHWPLNA